MQLSIQLRNARLAAIADTLGAGATLSLFSGPIPANCAAADPTGQLTSITLPMPFMTVASGVSAITGNWPSVSNAAGAKSFRMYDASGACHVQGSIPADMTLSTGPGQLTTITGFSITGWGA